MNGIGSSKVINNTAQLAAQFNDFYLEITSPKISQIGNYKIIKEIGEGAFGKAYLATHVLLNINVVLNVDSSMILILFERYIIINN